MRICNGGSTDNTYHRWASAATEAVPATKRSQAATAVQAGRITGWYATDFFIAVVWAAVGERGTSCVTPAGTTGCEHLLTPYTHGFDHLGRTSSQRG